MRDGWQKAPGQFLATVLALATLAGAYVGALSVNMLWLFIVLVPAAALVVTGLQLWPRVKRTVQRSRDYDRLLGQLEVQQHSLHLAGEALETLKTESTKLEDAARQRGRDEVMGAVQAMLGGADLQLVGVGMPENQLVIVARSSNEVMPSVGSRYELTVALTGETQGTVSVSRLSEDEEGALLTPVVESVPDFWKKLRDHARISSAVPEGLVLTTPVIPELAAPERNPDA